MSAAPAHASFLGGCLPGEDRAACTVLSGKVNAVDDGDTLDVHIYGAPGGRIRITGVQAMEQYTYNSDPLKRTGECHANEATFYTSAVVKMSHNRVRLLTIDRLSRSRNRKLRAVQVKIRGKWKDLGSLLVARGHALWMPAYREYAWNGLYSWLSQRAAARGDGIFNTTYCGVGPDQDIPIKVAARPNPPGPDRQNLNGEWIRIRNEGTRDLPLAGWWVRDSALERYTIPYGVTVPAGQSIRVRIGPGLDGPFNLYWGLNRPIFDNPTHNFRHMGDGAYLFDPDGDLRAWDIYPCRYNCAAR